MASVSREHGGGTCPECGTVLLAPRGQPAAWGQTLEARRCHPHGRKKEAEASGQLESFPAPAASP